MKLIVKKSTKPGKKYMALFKEGNQVKITRHFGASGMNDYTLTGDKEARQRYRKRHKRDLRTNDPTRSGFLSFYILWGESTSIKENIKNYKKRFNFD